MVKCTSGSAASQSDEKMAFLPEIKEEIKIENVEVAGDLIFSYDDDSFVDSSKTFDCEFDNNLENFTTEEDPLSLDQNLKNDLNNLESSHSVVNIDSTAVNFHSNKVDEKIFICYICKKKDDRLQCDNNIKIDHTYTKLHNFLEMENIEASSEEKYSCKFCPVVFESPRLYLLHLAQHGKEFHQCHFCPQRWQVKYFLKSHARFDEYPCELCGKSMSKRSSYAAHMARHYQKQCKVCKKMLPTFGRLLAHLKWCRRRAICSGCNQRFSTLVALKDHRHVCEEIQKSNSK